MAQGWFDPEIVPASWFGSEATAVGWFDEDLVALGSSGPTYTLTADSASFALTGQTAGLAFNRVLSASSAGYTLSGQTAGLSFNRVLAADSASYSLNGQAVTLTYTPLSGPTYTLTADTAGYALTGQDTGLLRGWTLAAGNGAYSLAGQDATLSYSGSSVDVKVTWLAFDTASEPCDVKVSWLCFDTASTPCDVKISWLCLDTAATGVDGDGSKHKPRKFYLRRKGKILLFDTAEQADAYAEAEEIANAAIDKAKSRGAKKRVIARVFRDVPEPVEVIGISELEKLIENYQLPYDMGALLMRNDYAQIIDIQAIIRRLQDDEDEEFLLIFA